jgi:PKD repeat protein
MEIVDQVQFGQQDDNKGYARVPNGTGNFMMQNHTYNASNNAYPNAAFTANINAGCIPFEVSFNNTSAGMYYTWNFGDGNTSSQFNPVHTYTTPGSYTVSLISSFDTVADTTVSFNLILAAPPIAFDFGTDTIDANSVSYNLVADPGYAQYAWSTGENSQGITINNSGEFCLTVTNSYSCVDSDCVYIVLDMAAVSSLPSTHSKIFPNPADEYIIISNLFSEKNNLEIYDTLGKLIYKNEILNQLKINTADWADGVYVCRTGNISKLICIKH